MRAWLCVLIVAMSLTTLAVFCARGPTLAPVVALQPPVALGPMPADPDEREGWVERIVERRLERALATNPAASGPVTDFLAQKLMEFVGRVVKGAIEAAVALALTAFVVGWLKAHWHWLGGGYLLHLALSWFAGKHGGKAATKGGSS